MEWFPQDAMKAYLHTLQLCKVDQINEKKSTKLIEPQCTEFVSALAAGKRARLMVEVTAEGITPLTIALAAAAKQTGGRLVCIIVHQKCEHVTTRKMVLDCHNMMKGRLIGNDLQDVVELIEYCGNPSEVIEKYMSVDFAVIDCKLEDHLKLYEILNLNPSGSTVVANNLKPRVGERLVNPFVGVLRAGKQGVVESHVVLPVGEEGMDRFSRFKSIMYDNKPRKISRRFKRFHVTFE